ncbi:MAG: serine/threonine protein kinase [Gammaproteobacteria bacterium]|nr:serine/threonine protein kinase [Gammaproteobacteria bacterium]
MDHESPPYADLTPDIILDAVDSCGYQTTGSLLALNSYENRVYQIGIENHEGQADFVIAKFYRLGRWDDATIGEEHDFAIELQNAEIPMVAPLANTEGQTLHHYQSCRFALFPRRGGHAPELDDPETLRQLGRFLGRIHAVGASQYFMSRPRLTPQRFGHEALQFLLDHDFIPAEILHNYKISAEAVLEQVDATWDALGPLRQIRLHGDCHPGNILWTDKGPHFVDLDDCLTGPAIQDLWMLLSGDQSNMGLQMRLILEGYETFFEFDPLELQLIESLRSLRILHYSAWLARRWHDPAFPLAFPWFNSPRYWEEQLYTLREQQERLLLPALQI